MSFNNPTSPLLTTTSPKSPPFELTSPKSDSGLFSPSLSPQKLESWLDGEVLPSRKVFIGGLSMQTSDENFLNFFTKFGNVIDGVVMRDKHTGASRGFGFVTYDTDNAVRALLKETSPMNANNNNLILDGKRIDAKLAVPKEEIDYLPRRTKKIFVGAMSRTTTPDEFKEYFSKFGTITECNLVIDSDTGRSRCFGFVSFEKEDDVEKVCLVPEHILGGKKIDVKKAMPKRLLPKPSWHPKDKEKSSTTAGNNISPSNEVIGNINDSYNNIYPKKPQSTTTHPTNTITPLSNIQSASQHQPYSNSNNFSVPTNSKQGKYAYKSSSPVNTDLFHQNSLTNAFNGIIFGNQPHNLLLSNPLAHSNISVDGIRDSSYHLLSDDKGLLDLGDPADKTRFTSTDTDDYNFAVASSLAALSLTDDDMSYSSKEVFSKIPPQIAINKGYKDSNLSNTNTNTINTWCHSEEPAAAITALTTRHDGSPIAKLLTRSLQAYANYTRIDDSYLEGVLLGLIFSSSSFLPADFRVHFQPLVGIEQSGSRRFADVVIENMVDNVQQELIIELKHVPLGLVAEETQSLYNIIPWGKKHGNAREKEEFERTLISALNNEYSNGQIDKVQIYLKAKFYQPLILPGDKMTIDNVNELWWLPTLEILRQRVLNSDQLKSYCHARQYQSQNINSNTTNNSLKVYRMSLIGIGPFITSSDVVLCTDQN